MIDFRYKRCLREYLEYMLRVHMLCKYERKWPHSVWGAVISCMILINYLIEQKLRVVHSVNVLY